MPPPPPPPSRGPLRALLCHARAAIDARVAALRVAATPAAGIAAAVAVGHAALVAGPGSGGGAPRALVADLAILPALFLCVWSAWRAGADPRVAPLLRQGWRRVALGTLAYALGNALLVAADLGRQPSPWLAQGAYALYYALVLAGLASFARAQSQRLDRARFWLDMAAVALAGGIAVWVLVLAPAAAELPVGPRPWSAHLRVALSLSYPVASLGVLFGAANVVLRAAGPGSDPGRRLGIELLATGGLLGFMADVGISYLTLRHGTYASGSWPDAAYVVSALCWVLAAEHDRRRAVRDADAAPADHGAAASPTAPPADVWVGRGASPAPYVAVAVGFAVLALDAGSAEARGTLAVAALLTSVVVARQVLAAREHARLLRLLSAREARFRAVFDQSPVGVVLVQRDGTILETNAAFHALLGFGRDELRGRSSLDLSPPDDAARTRQAVAGLLAGERETVAMEKRYLRRDGTPVWVSVTVAHAETDDGPCLMAIVQDVSERRRLEAELTHRAFHDALTGLANRALFRDRVEHALGRAARERSPSVAVVFVDLDDFKAVNDTLGHAAGDELLVAVATRLRAATRAADTVARLGGDEFGVLVEDVASDEEALGVAERIVASLRDPVRVRGRTLPVRGSAGVARASAGATAEALLRDADVAMYRAKHEGKGCAALHVAEAADDALSFAS